MFRSACSRGKVGLYSVKVGARVWAHVVVAVGWQSRLFRVWVRVCCCRLGGARSGWPGFASSHGKCGLAGGTRVLGSYCARCEKRTPAPRHGKTCVLSGRVAAAGARGLYAHDSGCGLGGCTSSGSHVRQVALVGLRARPLTFAALALLDAYLHGDAVQSYGDQRGGDACVTGTNECNPRQRRHGAARACIPRAYGCRRSQSATSRGARRVFACSDICTFARHAA